MEIKSLTIYCSSSNLLESKYYNLSNKIAKFLVKRNISIIYGGGKIGMMGVIAKTAMKNNGKVIGINTAIIAPGTSGSIGIGFAIPSNPASKVIDYIIDNFSCRAELGQEIRLDQVYSNIRSIYFFYQPEKCRALEIRCPPFISEGRKDSLCCLLYPSGKCCIVGGNNLSEIQAFFDWIKSSVTEKCPALVSTMLL